MVELNEDYNSPVLGLTLSGLAPGYIVIEEGCMDSWGDDRPIKHLAYILKECLFEDQLAELLGALDSQNIPENDTLEK